MTPQWPSPAPGDRFAYGREVFEAKYGRNSLRASIEYREYLDRRGEISCPDREVLYYDNLCITREMAER